MAHEYIMESIQLLQVVLVGGIGLMLYGIGGLMGVIKWPS